MAPVYAGASVSSELLFEVKFMVVLQVLLVSCVSASKVNYLQASGASVLPFCLLSFSATISTMNLADKVRLAAGILHFCHCSLGRLERLIVFSYDAQTLRA